jgi:hypothetical protein
MKKALVVHPYLFGLFPVLFLYSHNIQETWLSEVWLPTAVVLGLTLLLIGFLKFWISDRKKAGIIVSLFLVLFFSYGHVFNAIWGTQTGPQRFLVLAWGILFTCCVYLVRRTPKPLHNITNILNVASGSLVALSLINIGIYGSTTRLILEEKTAENMRTTSESPGADVLRDIYYIILDRYGSQQMLKEVFDFDNTEFIDFLSNQGFYVAHESRSNYLKTAHSLASSLNTEYINYLGQEVGLKSSDWKPLYAMLQNHQVLRFLKGQGYKIVHFGSSWDPTSRNGYADINFNVPFSVSTLPEFSMALLHTTILSPFISRWGVSYDKRREKWARIMYQFSELAKIPNIEEPTFVFAHMLIPHDPYVFDRNGNFKTAEQELSGDRIANHVDQLIFTNKKIKALIDTLLTKSEPAPIIILQGDEGSFPRRYREDEDLFDWRQATDAELREKTRILNTYFFPDLDEDVLYSSITPVNSFRVLFNSYFDTRFELLPDETYAFIDHNHLYQFFNVTDKVK